MFQTVPLSIIRCSTLYTQQWYMLYRFGSKTCVTYTIAVCIVYNTWWWTEELSKTCRVLFQNKYEKLVHLVGFIIWIYHDAWSSEHQICNTYCFSMATMVTLTCFLVTFIRTLPVMLCGCLRLLSGTLFVRVAHIYINCVLTVWQSAVPRPATTHVAPHSLITPLTPATGEPGLVPTLQ